MELIYAVEQCGATLAFPTTLLQFPSSFFAMAGKHYSNPTATVEEIIAMPFTDDVQGIS